MLLRHSMSYGEFEALARRVFVDVAMTDFTIAGKKPSISRAAILSGLTRRDVQTLVATPIEAVTETGERFNRAVRVLNGWLHDHRSAASKDEPHALPIEGKRGFTSLVRKHAGDVPVMAVLDELKRAGAVRLRADGRVELANRGYVPQRSVVDKLGMLGTDVADLIDTIDHNLQHGETAPRYQRKVMYHRVPVGLVPAFRKLSVGQSQALLERLDRWLHTHRAETNTKTGGDLCARVGVGIYHFEEPVAPSSAQGISP